MYALVRATGASRISRPSALRSMTSRVVAGKNPLVTYGKQNFTSSTKLRANEGANDEDDKENDIKSLTVRDPKVNSTKVEEKENKRSAAIGKNKEEHESGNPNEQRLVLPEDSLIHLISPAIWDNVRRDLIKTTIEPLAYIIAEKPFPNYLEPIPSLTTLLTLPNVGKDTAITLLATRDLLLGHEVLIMRKKLIRNAGPLYGHYVKLLPEFARKEVATPKPEGESSKVPTVELAYTEVLNQNLAELCERNDVMVKDLVWLKCMMGPSEPGHRVGAAWL